MMLASRKTLPLCLRSVVGQVSYLAAPGKSGGGQTGVVRSRLDITGIVKEVPALFRRAIGNYSSDLLR